MEVLARRGHEDEIEPWLDGYLPRLSDLPDATSPIDPLEWREVLGEGSRVGDWTEFFSRELKETPWRDVLETWWPRLLPGMAVGTTHGVIASRLPSALSSAGSQPTTLAELGHGLAFWAARFRGVPKPQDAEGSLHPGPAMDGLLRNPAPERYRRPTIRAAGVVARMVARPGQFGPHRDGSGRRENC